MTLMHTPVTQRQPLTVVKVGGKIVENDAALADLVKKFAALPGRKVLVHGGGRTATDIAARLGIETQMVGGRRVTDAEMLRVVTMVYAGLVNKNVVAQLEAAGTTALGLTGADMDVVRAHKRTGTAVDYGFVGDVDAVDGHRLSGLIETGVVPVMAPLTHDGHGTMLNTNADTMASEVAKALAAVGYDVKLVFCFEFAGVLADPADERSVIPTIDHKSFEQLRADGTVSGGMLPNRENCLGAIDAGVAEVVITRADLIGLPGGTSIRKNADEIGQN